MRRLIGVILGLTLGAVPAISQAQDQASPLATVNAFRLALESGRESAALELLAPELLVYESGDLNRTRSEYAAHHLTADMAFLAKALVRVLDQRTSGDGALAWVATRSRITWPSGDLVGTETMVLRREPDGWRIVHVHWSSRPATRNDD
jgi:hypothetical protein